jgi:methanesulfonate monooxygenase large subunit
MIGDDPAAFGLLSPKKAEGSRTVSRNGKEWARAPSVPQDHYVDQRIYSDQALFDLEIDRVRRKSWKFAAHQSELPDPFDFRVVEHAGYSIILRRGAVGEIRGFVNLCSHRGAPLLREPSGNAREWTCYFHQWMYDAADGACTAMPKAEGYACGPDRAALGLREVRVAVRCGLVFINLDDEAPSFEEFAGDAFELIEDVLGAEPYEIFHFHRSVVPANWKLWHETNMEAYHEFLHYLNRNVAMGGSGYFERKWRIYPHGHGALEPMVQKYQRVDGLGDRSLHTLPNLKPNEFRVLDLYPDTSILIRATAVRIDTSNPIGPNETVIECRGLGLKSDTPEVRDMRRRHHNQFWGPFGRNFPEDGLAIVEMTRANDGGGLPFPIFAREDDGRALDDALVRAFYREWQAQTGRNPAAPFAEG